MVAFSAYEFLNLILPGAIVMTVVFNDLLPENLVENDFLEALIAAATAFLLGHFCAGIGHGLEKVLARTHWSKKRLDPLLARLEMGFRWVLDDESFSRLKDDGFPSRSSADTLLELLEIDDHARMLSHQVSLHRNLCAWRSC